MRLPPFAFESIDILRRRIQISEAVAEVRGQIVMGTPKTHAARSVAIPGFLAPLLGEYLGTVSRSGLAFPMPPMVRSG